MSGSSFYMPAQGASAAAAPMPSVAPQGSAYQVSNVRSQLLRPVTAVVDPAWASVGGYSAPISYQQPAQAQTTDQYGRQIDPVTGWIKTPTGWVSPNSGGEGG